MAPSVRLLPVPASPAMIAKPAAPVACRSRVQAARMLIGAGRTDTMPGMGRQGCGIPQHRSLGVEDGPRRIVGNRVRRCLAQPDHLRAA